MEDTKMVELAATLERLTAAAEALEQVADRMAERQIALAAEAQGNLTNHVERIVATVESAREAELGRRLEEAEAKIAELSAVAASATAVRKTLPAGMASMLAKQGVTLDAIDATAIDGALNGLSVEQRIAVKSELMRAGLLG
jgi:hypothetical protein